MRYINICFTVFLAVIFLPLSVDKSQAQTDNPPIDLVNYRLLDMTYTFNEDTIYWPNSPQGFELESQFYGVTDAGFFYSSNLFSAPEHGGTHIDAPIHFSANKWTTDQIPVEKLVAPAVVIDISDKAAANPDYRLTVEDLQNWEKKHGEIPKGAIAMLYTGWGKYYPDRLKYLGDDTPGRTTDLHFPSYAQESAAYLVHKRGVSVLGIDTASIDYGKSTHFMAHVLVNEANVPGLENVAHLDQLPPTGAWVIIAPMKIGKGSGGPARVIGLIPR